MMRRITRTAVVTLAAVLLPLPTSGAAAEGAKTTKAVVYSDDVWTTLYEEPSEEQIKLADHKRLVVDAGTPSVLVLSVKMAGIPANPPGSPGFHASYRVFFKTVNRNGGAPILGNMSTGTSSGHVASIVNAGHDWQPCPGTAIIEPESRWVTFMMSKRCFRGKGRTITQYAVETRSYNYVVRSSGDVDDTEDVAEDLTQPRRQTPIRLR